MLTASSHFLLPSQLRILKFSLSVRAYSPKIEMFHQIVIDRGLPSVEECGAVVDVGGQLTCDVKKVKELVEEGAGERPVVYEVDHHYPGGENAKVGVKQPCQVYVLIFFLFLAFSVVGMVIVITIISS